jgi:ParB family chromosome partitioning protein
LGANDLKSGVAEIDLDLIRPGGHQPRTRFTESSVRELAESIKQSGVIQPVIVSPEGGRYVLVAGERRWRAAQMAGLSSIPAIVKVLDEQGRLEVALIENLQREDLNPIEEARAYRAMVRKLGHTQSEVAKRLGKPRSTVANAIRLLDLPREVQELIEEGRLPMGHARALLGLEQPEDRSRLAAQIVATGLSARQVEEMVQKLRSEQPAKTVRAPRQRDPNVVAAEERLARALRTRVAIRPGRGSSGRLEIHFKGDEELQRLYEILQRAASS